MAGTATALKIMGIIGILIMVITSILLWVYGARLRDGKDIEDKTNVARTFLAFGVMNSLAGVIFILVILWGCKEYQGSIGFTDSPSYLSKQVSRIGSRKF